jgi:hypothetical protein
VTADIKHTMALIWSTWKDLPKAKIDLQGYGDNELETLEALSDEAKTLRERCLEERGIRPSLTISGPVHEEILADAARQAGRDRN